MRAARDEVLGVIRSLNEDEWAAPSDAKGWSVRDVIAHLAWTQKSIVAPWAALPAMRGDIERANDRIVERWRALTPAQLVAAYEAWSRRALRLQPAIQSRVLRRLPIPLGGIGTYPAHLVLANGFVFDHWAHLRIDVMAPTGPIARDVAPADEQRMGPIVAWMLNGLPKMCGHGLDWVDRPIGLTLTGPGGGMWVAGPGGANGRVKVSPDPDGRAAVAAIVTSPSVELPVWGTRRRPWRTRDVSITGDEDFAARFCDTIHIV